MKRYNAEQKQSILDRYLSDREPAAVIIADTGIPKSTFYNWLHPYQEEHTASNRKAINIHNFHLLENKVARLEGIIEILKSASCTAQAPLREKLYAAEKFYGKYNVHMICEAFNISRETFYNHILRNKKDNTWYAKRREDFRLRIQEIYDENHQIFGADKIAAIMKNEGIKIIANMVQSLMRDMGLISIRQNAKKLYEDETRKCKNYINQNFDTSKPNQVWVSDVTYFKYNTKPYYICVIMDLFSRMVIGYKIGKKNSTQLVKSTLRDTYKKRMPDFDLIFHTDRGSNYRFKAMNEYIHSLHITHSFSRPRVPYDNSVVESFFSSMKREELYRTRYHSEADFYQAVSSYISFYNTQRPHQNLQYKTPA
ncbi:MAG: IS3 family transposase [Clostridia bacterium]